MHDLHISDPSTLIDRFADDHRSRIDDAAARRLAARVARPTRRGPIRIAAVGFAAVGTLTLGVGWAAADDSPPNCGPDEGCELGNQMHPGRADRWFVPPTP